jgi:hypothetical protein
VTQEEEKRKIMMKKRDRRIIVCGEGYESWFWLQNWYESERDWGRLRSVGYGEVETVRACGCGGRDLWIVAIVPEASLVPEPSTPGEKKKRKKRVK